MTDKHHRRIFLEEVQDLVQLRTPEMHCFMQLTRDTKNVWLISATPFPKLDASAQANNEILGIKRRKVQCELYGTDVAFEKIKAYLYIRNPER
jgi:hypothetical protein